MVEFTKMHGLGNDFVVLDAMDSPRRITPAEAAFLADRRLGVGCDQVIELTPPASGGDVTMGIFNPDGSSAEMCGNAARCVALFLKQRRGFVGEEIVIETAGGPVAARFLDNGHVAVDMGKPELEASRVPTIWSGSVRDQAVEAGGTTYLVTPVSMGNPHAVIFSEDVEGVDLVHVGRTLETHAAFPNRANVEFVQVLDDQTVRMRVWERGAGITPACGSGACAAAVAAALTEKTGRRVTVRLDGGDLDIHWRADDHVIMTGPARSVFRGTIDLEVD